MFFRIEKLAIPVLFLSSLMATSVESQLTEDQYLSALEIEVESLPPQKKPLIKVHSDKNKKPAVPHGMSSFQIKSVFSRFMQSRYPASLQIFHRLPDQQQKEVYENFREHRNIDKSRKEMLILMRKK